MTQSPTPDVIIYADGGGAKDSATGAGCIVELGGNAKSRKYNVAQQIKIVAFMGQATNNEAEISAILMGLAVANAMDIIIDTVAGKKEVVVKIVSDSEYALKSATQYIFNWLRNGWKTASREPVKNQGLWKVYLSLVAKLKIDIEHVKGHSGHKFNEACDDACTWARFNGEEAIDEGASWLNDANDHEPPNGAIFPPPSYAGHVKIHKNPVGQDWILADLRYFLDLARQDNVAEAVNELNLLINNTLALIES